MKEHINVYFDTEFTGLVPETTLISIGMIADNGAKFYAEFTDYNKYMCDDWIKENVLKKLIFDSESEDFTEFKEARKKLGIPEEDHNSCVIKGSSGLIRKALEFWFTDTLGNYEIILVGDVCHYDMVLLCNIFGGSMNLPKNVCPAPIDICVDLATEFSLTGFDGCIQPMPSDTCQAMNAAFDADREALFRIVHHNLPKAKLTITKHNSFFDALVIKDLSYYLHPELKLKWSE